MTGNLTQNLSNISQLPGPLTNDRRRPRRAFPVDQRAPARGDRKTGVCAVAAGESKCIPGGLDYDVWGSDQMPYLGMQKVVVQPPKPLAVGEGLTVAE